MKKFFLICALMLVAGLTMSAGPRVITNFDKGWKFSLGDIENAQNVTFKDAAWRTLDLPHDWSIEGENLESNPGGGNVGYFPMGIGWYRKTFNVPGYDKSKKYSI